MVRLSLTKYTHSGLSETCYTLLPTPKGPKLLGERGQVLSRLCEVIHSTYKTKREKSNFAVDRRKDIDVRPVSSSFDSFPVKELASVLGLAWQRDCLVQAV